MPKGRSKATLTWTYVTSMLNVHRKPVHKIPLIFSRSSKPIKRVLIAPTSNACVVTANK